MSFSLQEAIQILERTPKILRVMLEGIDSKWITFRKHNKSFSSLEVLGHLLAGEKTDWIPRMKLMLSNSSSKKFPTFNRTAFDTSLSLKDQLDLFENLRIKNIETLKFSVKNEDLAKTGIHPELGLVNLEQHLATWVVHDLTHLFQINQSFAYRYKETVGPWINYLKILQV